MQVIDTSTLGGAEKHTRLITKQFKKLGYEVILIFPPGPYAPEFHSLSQYGIQCIEFDFRKSFFALIRMIVIIRRLIRKHNVKYIHSHQHLADLIATIAVFGYSEVIHFSTIHLVLKDLKGSIFRKLKIFLFAFISLQRINFVFTVSNDVKKTTERYFHLRRTKVHTILNSIDFDELITSKNEIDTLRKQIDPTAQKKLLLCASVLLRHKGQEYLIESLKCIYNHNILLILLSDGCDKSYFCNLAEELGVSNKVLFAGYQKNVALWMSACDIYIHPSLFDPLPRSLLEAMFLGRPVIASNINSISEVIKHNYSGLLVEPRSPQSIADAIIKLLNSNSFSEQLSKNAQEFVKKNCSMESMAKKMISILSQGS